MKKAEKMNGLYKAGFIIMCVCLALLVISVVFMLVVEDLDFGAALAAAGVFLCLIAIILTMFSKPKSSGGRRKRKRIYRRLPKADEAGESDLDTENG